MRHLCSTIQVWLARCLGTFLVRDAGKAATPRFRPFLSDDMEALHALLDEVQAFKYDPGGFRKVVLTITGFYGVERELVKQLALHCRVR